MSPRSGGPAFVFGQEKRIFTFAKKREIALPLLPSKNHFSYGHSENYLKSPWWYFSIYWNAKKISRIICENYKIFNMSFGSYILMPCPFTGPKLFWAGPNFFAPDQKFVYILWQSQTFCVRQKDDLYSAKLVFAPAQMFLKRD